MIVVYPLKSQSDYTELKYSLRSIDKYLQPDEVIIVGDKVPGWINNVTWIILADKPGQSNFSVRHKTIAALEYAKQPILHMNDDIYLLAPYTPAYYSSGILKGKGESGAKSLMGQLEVMHKPTKYFGHYPAVYNTDFIDVLSNFTNECVTKSAYLNYLGVHSIEVPDCKILHDKNPEDIMKFITNKPCFSTGVHSLKSCTPILQKLFPHKSKYEV